MRYLRVAIALSGVTLLAQPVALGQRAGGWARAALGEAIVSNVHTSVSADGHPVVFATAEAGVFRAEDRGEWQPVILPPECSLSVLDFVPAPTDERIRYVLCGTPGETHGYSASDDGGTTWRAVEPTHFGILVDGGEPHRVYSLVVGHCTPNPHVPRYCDVEIDFSLDSGRTWQPLALTVNVAARIVASSPVNPDLVMAFTEYPFAVPLGVGFFRSTDGGVSWSHPPEWWGDGFTSAAIDPEEPAFLIASVLDLPPHHGTVNSTDGGLTWASQNESLFFDLTFAKDEGASSSLSVYAITDSFRQVSKSRDRGRTWMPLTDGLPPIELAHLTASIDGEVLYLVGVDGHLYEREIASPAVEGIGTPSPVPVSGRIVD
jgi:hypothetical protein